MAGTKITLEANGATSWPNFVTITGHARRHFQSVSFTNTTSTGAPAIESGSYATVGGTMYCLTPSTGGNETISTAGLSTEFTDGELWVKLLPTTGTAITAEYTTTPPTWSQSWGGYHSTALHKYIGGVYKSTAGYGEKWTYTPGMKLPGGETRPKLNKEVDIGVWNMDGTTMVTVSHGLPGEMYLRIRNIDVNIRIDNDAQLHPLSWVPVSTGSLSMGGCVTYVTSGGITLQRRTDGHFDGVNFNSTAQSRGTIYCEYEG